MVCFFVSGQAFLRGFEPVLGHMAFAAEDAAKCKEPEPKKELAVPKPKPKYKIYTFKHLVTLQHMRDLVVAFNEAFPEIKVGHLENKHLVIMGDDRKLQLHYLEVAKRAAEKLDKPELTNGYYIGNHIVRLKTGNACKIAHQFNKPATINESAKINKPAKIRVIGVSEKVLLLIPKEVSGITIELERMVAGFKSSLVKADEKIAKAQQEDEEKAKTKSPPPQAKPSVAQAKSSVSNPIEKQPEIQKKEEPGKKPGTEPKADTTKDSLAARTVKLEGLNAFTVAWAFRDKFPGYHFSPLSSNLLIIIGGEHSPMTLEEVKKHLAAADAAAKPEPPAKRAQAAIVRLFHLRNPAAVALAFRRGDDEPVKVAGPDSVLIDPKDGKLETIQAIERILAVLDLPRPQIGLQLWSMQVSTEDPIKTDDRLNSFRATVGLYNEELRNSLQQGWQFLMTELKNFREKPEKGDKDFARNAARDFRNYIEMDFMSCSRYDLYCLGYQDAFLAATPSLTRMLLFMAALPDPSKHINPLLMKMRVDHTSKDSGKNICQKLAAKAKDQGSKSKQCFERLELELKSLLDGKRLSVFRAAILDFLFHYKWARVYPREFVPYDLKVSAHTLDSLLTPIHDAFARDLGEFVEQLRKEDSYNDLVETDSFKKFLGGIVPKRDSKEKFYSNGLSRVTTLSGTPAKSVGATSNFFDITAPISLNELLKENELIDKGLPGVFQTKESKLAGIAANLLARPKVIAELGRGMTLTITPIALETAASAELQVDLKSGEAAAPAVVSGPTDKKPTIDRVTEHSVTDTVRVESLKLFEISTFGMQLEQRKDYIVPVVGDIWQAVFGGVPILNGLFRVEGGTLETISHRSIAIVSAMVVPTAMDLAYSIRFESDRELLSEGSTRIKNAKDLFADARAYHKLKMRCLRESKEPTCTGTDGGMKLTTSNVIGDEREISSQAQDSK
jgi:hypothetical protein